MLSEYQKKSHRTLFPAKQKKIHEDSFRKGSISEKTPLNVPIDLYILKIKQTLFK